MRWPLWRRGAGPEECTYARPLIDAIRPTNGEALLDPRLQAVFTNTVFASSFLFTTDDDRADFVERIESLFDDPDDRGLVKMLRSGLSAEGRDTPHLAEQLVRSLDPAGSSTRQVLVWMVWDWIRWTNEPEELAGHLVLVHGVDLDRWVRPGAPPFENLPSLMRCHREAHQALARLWGADANASQGEGFE